MTKPSRILLRVAAAVVALILVGVAGVYLQFARLSSQTYAPASFTIAAEVASADVALGERLFTIRNGCILCHGADLAGAMVMENPAMGSIWGPNISPGALGDWTDEQIAAAIRYGVGRDRRSLRCMPSSDFSHLSKADVAALIAYLRKAAPVRTTSHANTFGPLARILAVMGQMPVMFPARHIDQTAPFSEKPPEGPTVAFGKYLALDCVGCHGEGFRGGPIQGGDPSWPPAANIRFGNDPAWTKASFEQAFATGISPRTGAKIRDPMPVEAYKKFNQTELTALWLFLSSLK